MWRPLLSGPRFLVCFPQTLLAAEGLLSDKGLRRWNSNIKMTKQLKRMFDKRAGSKKKKIFPGPVNLGINPSEDADLRPRKKPAYTEGQKRRAHQVGKVLYDNIVHLVNSGALSDQLASLSVEIVRVKVVPDFSVVNVYWLSSGTKADNTVQTLLDENAGQLRHLLTSLHVLGSIPRICFVRDDSQARYLEVESLLRAADFGPDFVPTRMDSSIRDLALDRPGESVSPEDQLQAHFNSLNITIASDGLNSLRGSCKKSDLGSESEDKTVRQQGSDAGTLYASGAESGAVEKRDCQQHPAFGTLPGQPWSLDVERLGDQYLSPGDENADKAQKKSSTSVLPQHQTTALSKAFRDDMYKVPHTELWNKVLAKKQKAGLHLNFQVGMVESKTTAPKVVSTNLKSVLQRKIKPQGKLKRQSDYFDAGFEDMRSQDIYSADECEDAYDEEEADDEFSSSEDHFRRK